MNKVFAICLMVILTTAGCNKDVIPDPYACFEVTTDPNLPGLVTVNNCSQFADNFVWDFGDGATVSGVGLDAKHGYGSAGTYTITLTAYAYSTQKSTKVTKEVTVGQANINAGDYIGTWSGQSLCDGQQFPFTSTISAGTGANEIEINNFEGATGFSIHATVGGYVFTIPYQNYSGSYLITGTGTISVDGNTITINYTVTDGVTNYPCTATLTRQ